MKFPYFNLEDHKHEVLERFRMLGLYRPTILTGDYQVYNLPKRVSLDFNYMGINGPALIGYCGGCYNKFDSISQYFVDELITEMRRVDTSQSPIEWWNENSESLIKRLRKKGIRITNEVLREEVHKSVKGVGTFRPTNLIAITKILFPKDAKIRMLDPCAGFGDRWIAAMRSKKITQYVGVDPNPDMHPVYRKMERFFKDNNPHRPYVRNTKGTFIQAPFEDAEIKGEFDLVFTSPPYFNLEIYKEDEEQSISRYPTVKLWIQGFLHTLLEKSWSHLRKKGYMVIILNDPKGLKPSLVEATIRCVQGFDDAKYLGILSYSEFDEHSLKSPQPMMIWRKI